MRRPMGRQSVANFLGVGLDPVTYNDVFSAIDLWRQDKTSRSHHIACLNAYCVTLSLADRRLARIYAAADIAGPDGVPFVRWMRFVKKMRCDRIAAPDLIVELAKHSKVTGYTFFLYGGHPDVLEKMRENLISRFPHIKIVGHYSPPFRPLSPEEDAEICERINNLRPDIICVGLGTPKQDYWIDENIYRIKGSVMIASGAAFDFFGGRIKMAPTWVRNSGFEWLYRLLSKDFKRLWYRYTVLNAKFLWNFFLQITGMVIREPVRNQRPDHCLLS